MAAIPEVWDLDGDGRRWAVVVDRRIRWVGSREECQRRVDMMDDAADADGWRRADADNGFGRAWDRVLSR
jgi:hypothetical protein